MIVEPRTLIREFLVKTFRHKRWFEGTHAVPGIDAAIKHVLEGRTTPSRPRIFLFLIGGIPRSGIRSVVTRIETCLPSSKIILIDDVPGEGGIDHFPALGRLSLYDSQEGYCRYIEQFLREKIVYDQTSQYG